MAALFWEERKMEKKLHSNQKLANHKADSFSYYSVIGDLRNMKELQNIFYDSTGLEFFLNGPQGLNIFSLITG